MKINQNTKPKYNMLQNSLWMIRRGWQRHPIVLLMCLGMAIAAVLSNLAELFIVPVVLEQVESGAPLRELLLAILLFVATLIGCNGLRSYIEINMLFYKVSIRTSIINDILQKNMRTALPNAEDTEIMRMMEKARNACNTNSSPAEAIWETFRDLLKNVAGFLIYLLLLSELDPVLIFVILGTTVIGYFVNKRIDQWGYLHREEEAEHLKQLRYILDRYEDRALAKDIRIFGMQGWLRDVHSSFLRLYENFINRRESQYLKANVVDALLTLLRNGIAYFYLIDMALRSDLSTAQFLLYFSAVGSFTTWISGILSTMTTLHRQSLELSTIREYWEIPEPFLFEEGEVLNCDPEGSYELELKNISFRYAGAEKDTIHRLNLTIKPGEKLAIVGLNGAGKTTLVKLLCGFYDPTEGQVLLNGEDIRKYNRRDYYKLFGAVFQQFSLVATTIMENVTQDKENVDEEKVWNCLEKAGLSEKIRSLPHGLYNHMQRELYEDGVELSGGETQRLMLARALYKNAPIIVLDEPTAALDPIAENDIYMKYNEMCKERSSVFISHRLASTRFCDRIIYLEQGSIAEEGTHGELMKLGGKYAELFDIQSKYYQEGVDLSE